MSSPSGTCSSAAATCRSRSESKGGLLGADYKVENGRYRFARIFNGENWNPELRAPLTQPGVDVKVGDYLLEVSGREVRPPIDVYSYFENTAGTQIKIKVGPKPGRQGLSRSDRRAATRANFRLRNLAWEEDNRRKVDQMSGGKVAYVHVPDTATGGFINFNRYYFAQVGKQAAVIDERYNHGGEIADYIIDMLKRPLRNCNITREGEEFCSPLAQIYGPKTMVINEMSGSGGDALPWMFKQDKVGPLVGTRTWGGLVGIYNYPPLLDGGSCHLSARGDLWLAQRVGSGKSRHCAGHRSGERSGVRCGWPRSATRTRRPGHAGSVEGASGCDSRTSGLLRTIRRSDSQKLRPVADLSGFVWLACVVARGCVILFAIPSCQNFLKSKQ